MYTKKERKKKLIFDVLLEILGLVLLCVVLYFVQTQLSLNRQIENSDLKLDLAIQRMTTHEQEGTENLQTYDAFSQAKLDTIAYFYNRNQDQTKDISAMASQWGLEEMYIFDTDGNILRSNKTLQEPILEDSRFQEMLDTKTPFTEGTVRYYAAEIGNGTTLAAGRESGEWLTTEADKVSPAYSLKSIKVGNTGYIIAVSKEDNTIVYHPDSNMIGKTMEEAGIDDSHCETRDFEEKYELIAMVPATEIKNSGNTMIALDLVVFFIIVTIIILYINFIRHEYMGGVAVAAGVKEPTGKDGEVEFVHIAGNMYFNKTIGKRIWHVLVVGVVATFLISFYMQSLASYSRQSIKLDNKLNDIEALFDENADKMTSLTEEYNKEYTGRVQNLAYLMKLDPTIVTDDQLALLAQKAQVKALYVIDSDGKCVSTNTNYKDFSLSRKEEDQSYAFWDVVRGYVDILVQDATEDDHGDQFQYIGCKRLDADGMVQIGVMPQRLEKRLKTVKTDYVLENIAVENNGFLFAVDKESQNLIYYPDSKYIGRSAMDYGLEEAALADEYSGFLTINNQKCYVASMEYDSNYIYAAVPMTSIDNGRVFVAVVVTLTGLVVMLLIVGFALLGKPFLKKEDETEAQAEEAQADKPLAEPRGMIEISNSRGEKKRVQSVLSRWDPNNRASWNEKSAEQKVKVVMGWMFGILGLIFLYYMSTQQNVYNKDSIMSYIIHQKWEKKPNIFSVTYVGMIWIEVIVVITILRKVLGMTINNMGARAETIGRLVSNFIKYAAVIGAVFYSLNFIGIDGTTLIASAGILTLVVGLGAQSLVGDILAGIFIVFEGEFRVGDIVTIGDWRGTVVEIGVRSTKIEEAGQNIKIFNNSDIKGVINMTKKYSFVSCEVGIEYGESLERVESILKEELPKVKERIPEIEAGPFYKGVAALGDSSVVIKIVAQCQEKARMQLGRDLNRELKLLFDKNDINIPFPQIVLNQAKEYKEATYLERLRAEAFVKEQKELSKDIHDDEEEEEN